jgi:hypothetical protein
LKAAIAAAVAAGLELAKIQSKLGEGFSEFITTKTMLAVPEARALVRFAAEAGLQPDNLSPAVAVPLARVLDAAALLGGLYLAEVERDTVAAVPTMPGARDTADHEET